MFDVTFHPHWVQVRPKGSPSTAEMLRGIARAPDMANNLLVDVRCVGVADPTEHALLGSQLASHFRKAPRIALVVDEALLTYHSERAARRAGADLRVFTTLDDAQRWLQPAPA